MPNDLSYSPGLIYLACPFSHPKSEVQEIRVEAANRIAASLFRLGYDFFSPLSHGAAFMDLLPDSSKHDHAAWMRLDLAVLRRCETLLIIPLDGWQSSVGVNQEIREFADPDLRPYTNRIYLLGKGQWCAGRYFPGFDSDQNVWEVSPNAK